MGRIIFELSGFFFLPFLCYAAFLVWQQKHPGAAKQILHAKALKIQIMVGLVLMVGALIVFGLLDEHRTGGYSPAVFKDGKLIEGKVD